MSEELRGLKSEKQLLAQEGNALKLEKGSLLSKLVEVEAKITLLQEDQQKLWSVNETLNLEKEKVLEEKHSAEQLHRQEQHRNEALAAEREELLKEVNTAQEELLKINTENDSLQASKATLQALVEELQFSKDSLIAECKKNREEKDRLDNHTKKLVTEHLALAKDKDETIQKLQSSYEELAKDQKTLVQEIKDLTAQKKSALEKQSGLENMCIALKVERDALLQNSKDLQFEKDTLRQDQEKLNVSLAAALQVKQLLSAEASGLRTQLDDTSKALRKAELETLQLQATKGSLTKLLEEIQASRAVTDSECIQLLHEKETLAASERRHVAEKEDLMHENRLLAEKLSKCSEEAARIEMSLNEKLSYLTSEKDMVCQKISKIKKQLDSVLKEKSVLEVQNRDLLAERENSINAIGELKRKYDEESANRRIVVQEKMKLLGNLDALKKELQERKRENQELAATKCELSLMLKEAQNAKKHLEKEHTSIQQAKESLNAELETCWSEKDVLQEECQKLNQEMQTAQQSLLLEKEARAKDSESSLHENSKLRGRLARLQQELEEVRACAETLQSENCALIQEKTKSEQKVVEILKEKELLAAETARLAANIETLKSDFASLSKSKLELQELHTYLTTILDDLRLDHEVALADRAKALQDSKSLLAEKREVMLKKDELLKEKEKLAESYFVLQKEISQLAKTNSHISANLLESQNENRILRKDKSKLTLKIRELETLHSLTVKWEVPGLLTLCTNSLVA